MLPRSSMATSRFTSTFFAARAFEPAERLTVTMAGIISGAMPTAMASEKSSASMRGRDSATLTMKMNAVSTAATSNKNREKRDRPTSKAVWLCFSARPAAICPKAVRAPVRTTTPRADPWCTIVPMKAHPGWSCDWPSTTGATDLATGIDSPVSTPSSHSSSSTVSKRRSAGTRSPMRSDTTSPGTRLVTGTRLARPSLRTSASCRIWARRAAIAISARYSLKKPSPTLRATITAMITAFVPPPVSPDTSAAPSRRTRIGFRIWRKRTVAARTRWVPSAFGPNCRSRSATSPDESPSGPLPRRASTSSGGRPATSAKDNGASAAAAIAGASPMELLPTRAIGPTVQARPGNRANGKHWIMSGSQAQESRRGVAGDASA